MTKVLGRDDLLSQNNLRRELVPVPELGGDVWMRELSAAHVVTFKGYIDQLQQDGIQHTNIAQDLEIMTMVISFSVCDENGVLLFATPEEAKGLTGNKINVLMDLGNKALELSRLKMNSAGLTSEVADNLPNDPTTSSSANSPAN